MSIPLSASAQISKFFSPTIINTLSLWLDAADTSTMTFSSGSNISQWRDKSGLNNHATGVNSPVLTGNSINTYQAVVSATNQYFTGPISITGTTVTVFAVAQTSRTLPNSGIDQRLVSLASGGNVDYGRTDGVIALFNQGSSSSITTYRLGSVAGSTITTNTAFQVVSKYDGTTGYLWKNGTSGGSSASSGTFAVTKYGIGNQANPTSEFWTGAIGELIIYSASLSDNQRQQIEGYLASKWGLQSSLPSDHPYKTANISGAPTLNIGTSYRTSAISTPVFTPLVIPLCILWLDGQDLTTLFQNTIGTTPVTTSDQVVQLWKDKSSTANNASSSSSSMTYSQKSIYFPGSQTTGLSLSASQLPNGSADSTWFFVINATTSSTVVFMGAGSSGAGLRQFYLSGGNLQADKSGVAGISGTVAANTGANVIFSCLQSQSTTTLTGWQNGAQFGTKTFTFNIGTTGATIGSDLGSFAYTGYVGEVVVYSSTLSSLQRQQVEAYLARKWGVGSMLSTQNQFASPYISYATVPIMPALPMRIAVQNNKFLPTQIAGLVGWFDAADITTMTLSGSSVTQWRDKSVQANTATNSGNYPTLAQNAMNNRNVLVFSGSQYLTFTASLLPNGSTQNSIFIVSKQTAGNLAVYFSYGSVVGGSCLQIYYAGNVLNIDFYGASASYDNVSVAGVANIIEGIFTTTNTGYRNGIPFTTNNTALTLSTGTTFGYIGVGQSAGSLNYYLTGQIAEIVSFNTALTTEQRQQIEGYLAWKWGLKSSLPGDHPFSLVAPLPNP
jgi:hypothetical protein